MNRVHHIPMLYSIMKNDWILKLSYLLVSLGMICIICASLTTLSSPVLTLYNLKNFLGTFSILSLTGISSLIVGSGIGFIFSVPRTNAEKESEEKNYLPNTNLEQVSDWLTKILIGIGLTQLSSIWKKLYAISTQIASELTTIFDKSEPLFVASLIIYFLVSGFMICYLLTRLKLTKIIEETEK